MIGGPAAFCRFVRHDLRLSARGLMSMFGAVSPGRLAAVAALLFAALHAAAWPVAGWLIEIEGGLNGAARITMILATGAMLIIPWIVAQSTTDLTRTLFGRSDLELILSSPVETRSLLAARALSIAIGAVASVGLLLAPLADAAALRGGAHWLALYPALLAAGLMGTGLGVILAMGLVLAFGPRRARVLSQIAATTVGAVFVLGAQAVAMLPDRMRAAVLSTLEPPAGGVGALHSLVWTPVQRGGGGLRGDSWLGGFRRRGLRACLRALRRALRAGCDRRFGRAGERRRLCEQGGALRRQRRRDVAYQGAARRLARSLADVATSPAGRLYDAGRR